MRTQFVALGDTGTADPAQLRVAAGLSAFCKTGACDFALHLGDIIYPKGIQKAEDPELLRKFERPYAKLGVPFYLSLGNHDWYGNPFAMVSAWADDSPARKRALVDARLPDRYYTFLHRGTRFIAIDSNRPDDEQGRWLDRVLSESRRAGDRWVFAFGHHPRHSHGAHGEAHEPLRGWFDRLLCHRVDVYLAGHDHDKQLFSPRCGIHQVVSGAGASLRPTQRGEGSKWAASTLGWVHFAVSEHRLSLTFHDDQGRAEHRDTIAAGPDVDRCAADSMCESSCSEDPDCKGQSCVGDNRCNVACVDDPDCRFVTTQKLACPCDLDLERCNARGPGETAPCACDAACQAGLGACVDDSWCDARCPTGRDPNCG